MKKLKIKFKQSNQQIHNTTLLHEETRKITLIQIRYMCIHLALNLIKYTKQTDRLLNNHTTQTTLIFVSSPPALTVKQLLGLGESICTKHESIHIFSQQQTKAIKIKLLIQIYSLLAFVYSHTLWLRQGYTHGGVRNDDDKLPKAGVPLIVLSTVFNKVAQKESLVQFWFFL